MKRSQFAMRDCRKVLCRGNRYVIGETKPSGFGLWEKGAIFPIATYPGDLAGWEAAVQQFLALGDQPAPLRAARQLAG